MQSIVPTDNASRKSANRCLTLPMALVSSLPVRLLVVLPISFGRLVFRRLSTCGSRVLASFSRWLVCRVALPLFWPFARIFLL